jgi:hypothetical protein
MSNGEAKAFLRRVEHDEDFAAELADLAAEGDPSRVQARIRAEGYHASPPEVRQALLRRYPDTLTPQLIAALVAGGKPAGKLATDVALCAAVGAAL